MVEPSYTEISDWEMRALCEGHVREKEKETNLRHSRFCDKFIQPYMMEREISMLLTLIEKYIKMLEYSHKSFFCLWQFFLYDNIFNMWVIIFQRRAIFLDIWKLEIIYFTYNSTWFLSTFFNLFYNLIILNRYC